MKAELSHRDQLAMHAMGLIFVSKGEPDWQGTLAKRAYSMADAMLAEAAKSTPDPVAEAAE